MCSIRRFGGVVHIDEHDLVSQLPSVPSPVSHGRQSVRNLCSAFSYCLTILDTIYVWHGCGSTEIEREAAVRYSSRVGKEGSPAVQLYEGENDDDELFWMALGDDEYAKANYWQWRRQTSETDPQIWHVDAKANPPVSILRPSR